MIQCNIIEGIKVLALIRSHTKIISFTLCNFLSFLFPLCMRDLHRAVATIEQHVLVFDLRLEDESSVIK